MINDYPPLTPRRRAQALRDIKSIYDDFVGIDLAALSPSELEDYRRIMDELRLERAAIENGKAYGRP